MQKYKIVISYDGTDYFGWQRQPRQKTIQGILESSLEKITKEPTTVIGAGRTDAGVHALGQTAHFQTKLLIKNIDLLKAMNSLLPHDIRILSLRKAPPEFHARKSARSKIYRYRILNSSQISPFLVRYVYSWASPLEFSSMRKAASLFIREDDFTPFSSNRLLHPVRKVSRASLIRRGDEMLFTIEANGFLRYMVRVIVGTILEIGKGKFPPDQVERIFQEGQRSLAGPTAPAKGLSLIRVFY